jgi:hypothetical protein
MSQYRYPVTLTAEQRDQLTHLIRTGTSSSYHQVVVRLFCQAGRKEQRRLNGTSLYPRVSEQARRSRF